MMFIGAEATAASEGSPPKVLGLVLNGHITGLVGEFARCDGEPCASAAQLVALGFIVPPELLAGDRPIRLAILPGVQATVDEARQMIDVTAEDAYLRPSEVSGQPATSLAPLSPSGYGAVLNYDMVGTLSHGQGDLGALINLRGFSPYGIVEGTVVATIPTSGGSGGLIRLNTTYTHSDPDRLRRLRIGDVVTGALPWNRAVRIGGIQISSDFNLRPDLVTYPLPTISASTTVPATVDLIVNDVRQSSEAVPPGPFAVHVLPVITGAGQVSITIQDALGRQTFITLPFYASNALLAPGLTNYSVDAGMIRNGFGSRHDHYAGWAATGSARRGMTDWLTVEAHGEASSRLGVLGGGIAARIGTFGIANLALSGSGWGGGSGADGRYGGLVAAGFQRVTRRFNFSVNGTYSTIGYRDNAAIKDFALPRTTLNVSAGYQLDRWGVLGLSYIARTSYGRLKDSGTEDSGLRPAERIRFRIANASYSVRASSAGTFYVNGYRDFTHRSGYGVSAGFSVLLGGSTSASIGASLDSGRSMGSASIFRSAVEPNDIGYRLLVQEGSGARRMAELEYLSPWGRVSGGLEQYSGQVIGRLGARGALALFDGKLFASDHVDDSFAIVRTGDVGGVPVRYENRSIGVTDKSGRLLVPSLLSYQNNRIALDTIRLPPDVEVGQTFTVVRPADGSGIRVDFSVKKVHGALVRLRDMKDRPIPLGSTVQVAAEAARPVGYDGEVYLTELRPINRLEVTQPNGSTCIAHLEYMAVNGDIPVIGPVLCQ
ncbi:MAG: fimbria/pilus outer membrane usher protein [Sphingomicrobium sp.]